MDLFTPVVEEEKLHKNFARTIGRTGGGVREVLKYWVDGFTDRDGKFVREFQTTYNSSFWELYLFAVLKHLGIKVDFTFASPDFVAAAHPCAIEATIAGHAADAVAEWEKTFEVILSQDPKEAINQTTIRLANALHAKSAAYQTKYSVLPHMANRAYIVAISNFATPNFYMMGDTALQRLLYDPAGEKTIAKANGAPVPLGLFRDDGMAHISGILYSSVASFGKARALGPDGNEFNFRAGRERNGHERISIIAKKSEYKETLTDGLRYFSNPFATTRLDAQLFRDEGIKRYLGEKDGKMLITCSPEGDLDWRQVIHLVPK
jgi:hypothetical protein